ncbi:short-chain dehydrogenase/reductase family 9C member 7-like [Dendropsophus ebraccatus]|uniref:short-chain dehydrogenase/reductase family 9C member 7-like n=1 Tax=Dendropsophus ebraccatus TaxID=150705 RepID=UPI003831760D
MWLLLLLVVFALMFLYRWYRQSLILENLTGKYVFITGCDTGFGNLLAKQLDKRGMKVLAACLTDHGAKDLKKETSSRLQTMILDVTNSKSVSSAAESVSSIVGDSGLWGLVNNAGTFNCIGPNEWHKKEDFLKDLNVNLVGMVDMTLHLLPLIRKARGRIVNVSSGLGRLAALGGGYCMSKSGVETFSDSLRREVRDFGVKVSIIEPGCFQTPLISVDVHENNLKRIWENLPTGVKDSYGQQYYDQYVKYLKALLGTANPKTFLVPNSMEHALTAVYPWTRYSPGLDSKLLCIPVSYLPTVFSDYWLRLFAPKPADKEC